MDKQDILAITRDLIEDAAPRDKMFDQIDEMLRFDYELPDAVRDMAGVHKVVTSEPFDAVSAATRVLSAVEPLIKIHPLAGDPANQEQAETWEQVASWWFHNLNRRKGSSALSDLVRSAVTYDEVCLQTVYLPWQEKALKAISGKPLKRSMRRGPFVWNVYNPRNVYTMHGDTDVEAVLLRRQMPVYKVKGFWGDLSTELMERVRGLQAGSQESKAFRTVTLFDYMDGEYRYVWAVPSEWEMYHEPNSVDAVDILPLQKHDLPFIPWVSSVGGSNLFEENTEFARLPMLYPVVLAGSWETQNIAETLVMSKAIALAGKPAEEIQGPDPSSVHTDYTDLGGQRLVPPGHQVTDLAPPPLDGALLTLADRVAGRVEGSTVSRILSGGDVGATSFSALNLMTQTAVGAISPYKRLAEITLAEGIRQMFWWVEAAESDTQVYYGTDPSVGQIVIEPDEIPVENLYVDVRLEPDVPTDRMQRINGAQLLINMGYPAQRAFEEAGIPDPKKALREGYQEQFLRQEVDAELERRRAEVAREIRALDFETETELQIAAQQRQAEAQQALQEQQQQAEQPQGPTGAEGPLGAFSAPQGGLPGGFALPPGATAGPPGIPGIEGAGFDPAQGGVPPAQADPFATREQQSGEDVEGNPISGGGIL